jgi:hypothetical protein
MKIKFPFPGSHSLAIVGDFALNKRSGRGLVGSTLAWESVGFNKGIPAVGESVDKLLAVGRLVCFNEGLAVGESINKLLAMGNFAHNKCSGWGLVGSTLTWELVGFNKGILSVGESVDKLLAVGGSVCFHKGPAVGESVDKLLAMGGLVCFDEGLAVGESINELVAMGGLVCFNEGLAVRELGRIR